MVGMKVLARRKRPSAFIEKIRVHEGVSGHHTGAKVMASKVLAVV